MAEAPADTAKAADQPIPPKADAGIGGTALDAVLSKLDSLHKRMDEYESKAKKADDGDLELKHEGGTVQIKGKPPEEAAGENKSVTDKKRKDSVEADEAAPATTAKRLDAAKKPDWDDEDEEKKDSKSKKADAKKKADEDEDEDEDKKGDALPPQFEKKEDKKKDAAVAKGDARADEFVRVPAADWKKVNDQLASIHSFVNRSDEDRAAFADAQARADSIYGAFGKRAPANLPGERLADYQRRLVTPFRKYSPAWVDVKMSELPDSAFANVENLIYADAMKAAENPPDLGEGELRRRDIVDPETRMHRIEWQGNESFIKGLSRPPRRVAGFRQRTA